MGKGWSIDYAVQYPVLSGQSNIIYLGSAYRSKLLNISHFKIDERFLKSANTELLIYDVNEKSIFEISRLFKVDGEDVWNLVYM